MEGVKYNYVAVVQVIRQTSSLVPIHGEKIWDISAGCLGWSIYE